MPAAPFRLRPSQRPPHAPRAQPLPEGVSLALQVAGVGGACLAALALFAAHPASPYASVPEVAAARHLAAVLFWKAVDGVYNPLHYALVAAANAALLLVALLLPLLQTLPEAALLAVTELGGLVLDVTLVLAAAARAAALRLAYLLVLSLDWVVNAALNVLIDADAAAKALFSWALSKDPAGLALSLLLARPFEAPARLLLAAAKLGAQWTMAAVELACALLFATPALLGVLVLPLAYAVHAVLRRARRTVVTEPQLSFSAAELQARLARLQPLTVPPLPVAEKAAELEIVNFVNAAAQLQPLRAPPLPLDALRAANEAAGVGGLSRAAAVDAVVERDPGRAQYTVSSSTVVSLPQQPASYDGLQAVKAEMDALSRVVQQLPPLADARRASGAQAEAAAAAAALAQAELALAEAEAAFSEMSGTISATTTTVTSLSAAAAPVGGTEKRVLGNGPGRTSPVKAALIRGLAAGLSVASQAEEAGTGKRRAQREGGSKAASPEPSQE